MHVVLRSGVDDHKFARLHYLVVEMVVEGLPVLGQDRREGHAPALLEHKTFHLSDNLLLHYSKPDIVSGDGVHLLAKGSGIVKFLNLTWFLDESHRDYGLDELL